jgi:hypothetical protein
MSLIERWGEPSVLCVWPWLAGLVWFFHNVRGFTLRGAVIEFWHRQIP